MNWWEQFGLSKDLSIEYPQFEEVFEIFSTDGYLLSYYPVTIGTFVGTEKLPQILKLAVVMSRTIKVDNDDVSHEYFLNLKPSLWNEYVEHLDI